MRKIATCVLLLALITSCNSLDNIDFTPMANIPHGDTVFMDMDMQNAVTQGIVIPSLNQTESGFFDFKINTNKRHIGKLYYKIYYQNESYKFPEDNDLSNENFYGSWEDTDIGFKPLNGKIVVDSLRIVGNPRNEAKYYGDDITQNPINKRNINKCIERINNNEEWHNSIVEKAKNKGVSIDEQLYTDAVYMLNLARNEGESNNRWKRNPRVGAYSFILVVCDKEGLDMIPNYIKDISKTDENGNFVNPYTWLSSIESSHIKVIKSPRVLKTRAVISVDRGIYKEMDYNNQEVVDDDCDCGYNDKLYHNALYEQFICDVSHQYTLRNIPLIKDVVGDNPYTRNDYEKAKQTYKKSQLHYTYPVAAQKPCQTVKLSPDSSYISIINPHSTKNNMKKEAAGIRSRIGFTYGKWRGKIKFPVMLNDDNMWNGLTYAFWLIYSDIHPWNNRRHNEAGGGYAQKNDKNEIPARTPDNTYSEIDIEIVKTSRYWPKSYYERAGNINYIEQDERLNNDVMYCCTNWDLAVPSPQNYFWGLDTIRHENDEFEALRWDRHYKALTERKPMNNNDFKEQWCYYEIDWRPSEIIWRLGTSPDNMRVMGYMNSDFTDIPNNQMRCIVTQEYHYSEWWPPVVYEQGLIPYNKTDIEGRVYEIVVE